MVVIVFGLPGSGKSYFACRLAEKIDAFYLNSDQVRMEMFSSRTYSNEEKDAVYSELLTQAERHVKANRDVIIDATFYKQQLRDLFHKTLEYLTKVLFIEVVADEKLVVSRVERPRKFSEANAEVYRKIKSQWEPLNEEHLLIESTENNIDIMLDQSLQYLNDSARN